jgi:hypothetical protein
MSGYNKLLDELANGGNLSRVSALSGSMRTPSPSLMGAGGVTVTTQSDHQHGGSDQISIQLDETMLAKIRRLELFMSAVLMAHEKDATGEGVCVPTCRACRLAEVMDGLMVARAITGEEDGQPA